MRKILSTLTALAMIVAFAVPNVWAYWSALNWTVTWTLTAAWTLTVTVSSWVDFTSATWALSANSIKIVSVTWSTVASTNAFTASSATTLAFTHSTDLDSSSTYMVSFRTVWADLAADTSDDMLVTAMLYWGNTVSVTATVEPVLTLSLAWTSVAFWVLNIWQNTWATVTTGTVATNAAGWFTAYIAASTWWLASASAWYLIASASWITAGEYFDVNVAVAQWTLWNWTISASTNFDNDSADDAAVSMSAQALASWNGTTDWDVFVVTYKAWITAVTPAASDYATTVTYTVTWSF